MTNTTPALVGPSELLDALRLLKGCPDGCLSLPAAMLPAIKVLLSRGAAAKTPSGWLLTPVGAEVLERVELAALEAALGEVSYRLR